MAGLGLPKLRWLIVGAVAAGIWVVREDMKAPRPPERVGAQSQQSPAKERPQKPVAAKSDEPKKADIRKQAEKPVPPRPVTGKQPNTPKRVTALTLPRTVERPPSRPQKIVTGSVSRPAKPTFIQTRTKVNLRAQARADAAIIVTLQPGTVMRELARSGQWRLVMGDGRKGWLRDDYVEASNFLKRRPRLPVADVKKAEASTGARP
ncbi:MAG: hypothetical protein KF810_07440 [Rhizobiaceae bacterium]|nr:hypothetical protein [Rhizobiaceae bacterium]